MIDRVVRFLKSSLYAMALTGAGISTEVEFLIIAAKAWGSGRSITRLKQQVYRL